MLDKYLDVIILCGGIGTRAAGICETLPKCLLPIQGKTILEWQLKMLFSLPVRRVILATCYLSNKIEEFCKYSNRHNIVISKANQLLDTGGALKDVVERYAPMASRTLVLNGDIFCNMNFRDMVFFFSNDYEILMMTVFSNSAREFGSVKVDENKILSFKEKAAEHDFGLVNGGFYIFSSSVLKNLPDKRVFSLEHDVFPHIDSLFSYYHNGMWHDVGNLERYNAAKKDAYKIGNNLIVLQGYDYIQQKYPENVSGKRIFFNSGMEVVGDSIF